MIFTPTVKSSGLLFKTCDKYRTKDKDSNIYEHNTKKSTCIQCGKSKICEHNKRKPRCIQCGGSEVCENDKIRSKF